MCPVTTIPEGVDFDGFLATLGKKERHEIRRKIRRAESPARSATDSSNPLADLDDFIDLHQKRWGAEGLFPPTPGGDCSRRFLRHLFRHFGPDGRSEADAADRRRSPDRQRHPLRRRPRIGYYNAGVDPDARDLSPGV